MSLFDDDLSRKAPSASSAPWVYAHCDGGSRGNPGPAGYGAVVTDANGRTLAELSEFLGKRTNNFAEYSGLLAVLEWALANGHRRVKVVSDSKLMVEQVSGRYKVNSPDLKPLWQTARDRIARLEAFEFTHALRHKNKDADALANQAMDRGMGRGNGTAGVDSLPLRAPRPQASTPVTPAPAAAPAMLRGITKGGVVHLLGSAALPDGVFVKIIRE